MSKQRKKTKETAAQRKARVAKGAAAAKRGRNASTKRTQDAAREVMAERVMELRGEGKTFRQIRDKLKISVGEAHELFHARLAAVKAGNNEVVKRQRAQMTHDIGALMEKLFGLGMSADVKVVDEKVTADGVEVMELAEFEKLVKTTASYGKLAERLAKLLGLDSPAKVDIGGTGGGYTAAEIARRLGGE